MYGLQIGKISYLKTCLHFLLIIKSDTLLNHNWLYRCSQTPCSNLKVASPYFMNISSSGDYRLVCYSFDYALLEQNILKFFVELHQVYPLRALPPMKYILHYWIYFTIKNISLFNILHYWIYCIENISLLNILHCWIYFIIECTLLLNILTNWIFFINEYTALLNILHYWIYFIVAYTSLLNILHYWIYCIIEYTSLLKIFHYRI